MLSFTKFFLDFNQGFFWESTSSGFKIREEVVFCDLSLHRVNFCSRFWICFVHNIVALAEFIPNDFLFRLSFSILGNSPMHRNINFKRNKRKKGKRGALRPNVAISWPAPSWTIIFILKINEYLDYVFFNFFTNLTGRQQQNDHSGTEVQLHSGCLNTQHNTFLRIDLLSDISVTDYVWFWNFFAPYIRDRWI